MAIELGSKPITEMATICQEFEALNLDKADLITRCERYAGWTIPSLFLPTTSPHSGEMQHDFQSVGSQAVNHLANKLVFALFSPTVPFFRLDADDKFRDEFLEEGGSLATLTQALSKIERVSMKRLLKKKIRANMVMAMKQLIVTGNCLLFFPKDDAPMQVYMLRDYAIRRDLSGEPTIMIMKDRKKLSTLDPVIQQAVRSKDTTIKNDADVNLYTKVTKTLAGTWEMTQAVDDIPLDSTGTWRPNMLPWIPLTWTLPRGWYYGTGLVEDFAGDFHAMSMLSESLVQGAAIASDLKFLVDPSGMTDVATLNRAQSGDYVPGRPNDIHALQVDKQNDWGMVSSIIQQYERRIGQAFLLNSAVTRDAERVTAQEMRIQAQELETGLGGVYSRLADELQIPLAYQSLRDADLDIDGNEIEPVIITGMDSLARNTDADNLMLYLNDLAMIASLPESVQRRLKPQEVMQLMAGNRGVDILGIVKSEKEVEADMQQEMQAMQSMPQQGAPAVP